MRLGELLADPRNGRWAIGGLAVALVLYASHYAKLCADVDAGREAVSTRVAWTGRAGELALANEGAWRREGEAATAFATLADEIEAGQSISLLSRPTDSAAVAALREASRAAASDREAAREAAGAALQSLREGTAALSWEIGELVDTTRMSAIGGMAFGALGVVVVAALVASLGEAQHWRRRWTLTTRATADGLWDWDLDKGKVDFSDACRDAAGLQRGSGLDDWFDRIHPDDAPAVRAALDAHLAGSTPVFEVAFRLVDGFGGHRFMLARGLADRDPAGRPRHVACWQTDISDRRDAAVLKAQTDTAMRAQGELRAVIDALPDCVLVLAAGEVAYANAAARSAFGGPDSMHRVAARLRAAAGGGVPATVGTRNGLEATWEVAPAVPIRWDDIPAEVVAARDISGRLRIEGQLRNAERVIALGGLAAGLAHEINNPLTYVIGNLELAQQQVGDVSERVSRALEGATRVRQVVAQLRAMANPSAGELVPTHVGPAIEGALTLAGGIGMPLAAVARQVDEQAAVLANPVWLGQLLVNLVNNSLQAMAAQPPDTRVLSFRVFRVGDGTAAVEVEDTGPGIPANLMSRIFEPFTSSRLQTGGSGLGLYICRELASRMGGSLALLRSGPAGTCFRLTLRLAVQAPAERREGGGPAAVRRGRVLIVDDEAGLGDLMRTYLSHHEVRVETSGEGGATALATGRWDAIVLDIVLPDRSGIELWRELFLRDPSAAARVCFVTGGSLAPDVASFLVDSVNPSLVKPFDFRELVAHVDNLVAQGAPWVEESA
ncbi:MAG: response regulator [Deltaproteobacteria bacterium]|nr:response regulator [Deltaproteobacteria bacterium]